MFKKTGKATTLGVIVPDKNSEQNQKQTSIPEDSKPKQESQQDPQTK